MDGNGRNGHDSHSRRVVITGIGPVTPIGIGRDGLWQGVLRGEPAVRPLTRFDASAFATRIAAEVAGFDPRDHLDARKARRLDRYAQFAVAGARLALEDARLDLSRERSADVGVYIGSALGGVAFAEEQHFSYYEEGLKGVHPMLALAVFTGAASTNIAIEIGATGPTLANGNGCAASAVALGEAFRLIKSGGAAVVFAGGVEAPLAPLTFGAFVILRAMSTRNDDPAGASRPFDRDRDGFVMGEGSAILVLEELGHALRRDAPIYAEVLGYGTSTDAYHMTAPLPSGREAARAIGAALAEAGLAPEQLDYVNAHASSTPVGDRTEALALYEALGDHGRRVPVSGTKGLHAHPLGAAGAFEAAICALAIEGRFLPGTANLADPECDLNYIPAGGAERAANYVLSNSAGFGGINAALVLGRYRG